MIRLNSFALVVLAALLPIPLYVVSVEGGFTLAPLLGFDNVYTRAGFGLPVAFFAIILVGLLWLLSFVRNPSIILHWLVAVVAAVFLWMLLVAVYGIISSERPVVTASLFIQTVLPLVAFAMLLTLPVEPEAIQWSWIAIPIAGSISTAFVLLAASYYLSHYELRYGWALLGEAIYGVKTTYPPLVAAGIAVILSQLSSRRRLLPGWILWAMLTVQLAFVLVNWSRSGLVSIFLVCIFWLSYVVIRDRRLPARAIGAAALIGIFFYGGLFVAGQNLRAEVRQSVIAQNSDREIAQAAEPSMEGTADTDHEPQDARRFLLLKGAIERVAAKPIAGDAFNPLPPGTIIGGVELRSHVSYPAHNQTLDIGVRSGIPGILLYGAFLLSLTIALWLKFWRNRGTDTGEIAIAALFVLVAVTAASQLQAHLVVTATAVLTYMISSLGLRIEAKA